MRMKARHGLIEGFAAAGIRIKNRVVARSGYPTIRMLVRCFKVLPSAIDNWPTPQVPRTRTDGCCWENVEKLAQYVSMNMSIFGNPRERC